MGAGLPTSAQLDAFRQRFGTFFPCHSVWCSATLQPGWLATVDFAPRVAALRAHSLTTDDATMPAVQQRLQAGKRLQKCSYAPESKIAETELATAILAAHKPATRTLVVCNTVKSARALFAALQKRKPATPLLLLHSRFRPPDRQRHLDTLLAPPPESGLIAVATQVIEAGVDVSAATLFTELAPWASMVQRFGRCNRAGEFSSAQVFWVDMDTTKEKNCLPYTVNEMEAARRILNDLDDVGPSSLPEAHDAPPLTQVLRAPDMVELFDTTPDMTGAETDVSRYIRESSERDVHVFWRPAPENGNPPAPTAPAPQRDELCAVSIHELRPFLKGKKAWRWDYGDGQWQEQTAYDPLYPGMVLWLPASSGGYTEEQGFIATGKKAVPSIPLTAATPAEYNDADTGGEWQSLHDHALQCKQVMGELLRQLCPASTESLHQWEADLLAVALYHDWGKAHSVYQTALGEPPSATVWAKGPSLSRYTRKGFRHELASALALLQAGQSDLTAYLAAAHHGKVRLSIRSTPQESPAQQGKRFARGVHDGDELPPVVLDTPLPRTVLSLACMELGRSATGASWLERMVRLRDAADLGIFRLAYLETLVRVADWRASATGTADPQAEETRHA